MKYFVILLAIILSSYSANAAESIYKIRSGECLLEGTYLTPDSVDSYPFALIISGSGPTDRDGNTVGSLGKNNSLKMLAEELLKRNIATFRYDKRGIGKSADSCYTTEEELDLYTFKDDALSFLFYLKKDQKINSFFIIGHSEGALITMMSADHYGMDGAISIAGAGRSFDSIIIEQLITQKVPENVLSNAKTVLDSLNQGIHTEKINPVLMGLFRPSIQNYLIDLLQTKPTKVIAEMKTPVLIIQGTTDIQVKVEDAKLLASNAKKGELVIIEGMNHVLKDIESTDQIKQFGTYYNPNLPINKQLVNEIEKFIIAKSKK